MMKRGSWISIAVIAIGLSLLLSATNLFLGNLNQDEGWYLYAAKQITEGHVLYRDFMFTQGPALPIVYGVLFPVVEKLGVAGGRLITTLFGFAAAGCAAWLAGRSTPRYWKPVSLAAFVLTAVNVYQSYFTTIVKTYGLCAFFLTAGFVALSYANSRRGAMASFWGGFLLALAACTRLSAGVVLPVAGIWLICNRKKVYPFGAGDRWQVAGGGKQESGVERRDFKFQVSDFRFLPAWLAFGLGGGFILLIGLGTFFALAPENTLFALLGYHEGRSPGSLMTLATLKAGFASRFVQAYFVFAIGCVLAFFFRRHLSHTGRRMLDGMGPNALPRLTELLQQANQQESPFSHSFISLLWMAGTAVTLVHFTAPFPYDDYQVIVYPVLAAALAATLVPRCPEKYMFRTVLVLLLICTAASFSSPINQEWMIRGRDRIWWKFKETPDLLTLQKAGRQIQKMIGNDGLLLTQDTYLAIEARTHVPHGMEMGPFCYYPDMPRKQAEKLNLLNKEMMEETLAVSRASIAAFSGYGLSISSPQIAELSSNDREDLLTILEKNYQKTAEIPCFGQAWTTLNIFCHQ